MAIQATVTMVNTAAVSQSIVDQVETLTRYALEQWGAVLAGSATANVTVSILENTSSGRAQGGNETFEFLGQFNGNNVFEPGVAYELRTGKELGEPGKDIHIQIDRDYLLDVLFLDPTPATANDIPLQRTDAIAVLIHEVGHALGFIGYYHEATNSFAFNANTPYDSRLVQLDGETFFDGPNVIALFGEELPLTDHNFAHYGNTFASPIGSSDPLTGLMNGVVFYPGYRYGISTLDLAVMADLGIGTIRDDIFDLPYMRDFNGGAGMDTVSYARSSVPIVVSLTIGGPQNIGGVMATLVSIENLIGSQHADTLAGNDGSNLLSGSGGNDVLNGAGDDDELNGGTGTDTAVFSGDRFDYLVTVEGEGYRLKDQRSGVNDGNDLATGIEVFEFATGIVLAADLLITAAPGASNWRMFATGGFVGEIGGRGALLGSPNFQDIAVLDEAGVVSFDPSFSRGGDILRLPGDAGDWQVSRSGSVAVFTDGDSFVQLPIGTAGIAVVFDDGARTLKFDAGAGTPKIGQQAFGTDFELVTAAPDGTVLPTGANPAAQARLFLAADAEVSAGGKFSIFGTNGSESVTATEGSFLLDPSFSRGGDTLLLEAEASDFTAVRQGSALFLDSAAIDLLIPVGTTGMAIVFGGEDQRELTFDTTAASIRLGEQLIGLTPVALADFA